MSALRGNQPAPVSCQAYSSPYQHAHRNILRPPVRGSQQIPGGVAARWCV